MGRKNRTLKPWSPVIFLIFVLYSSPAFAKYSGGTGEPNTPYQIATSADLNDIGNHPEDFNKCFLMTADINLSQYTGSQFKVIGNSSSYPFQGIFDGNGHTISNFTFISSSWDNVGLFGHAYYRAIIVNLGMINPLINAGQGSQTGGLVGNLDTGSKIENCYIERGSISGKESVGGLVGFMGLGTSEIRNCWASSDVNGTISVGGLAGQTFCSNIYWSYSKGTVIGHNMVGGLIGYSQYDEIIECFATGNVTKKDSSSSQHGGLIGYSQDSYINNSYARGNVIAKGVLAGLIGYMQNGEVNNCYSTGYVSGSSYTGGLIGDTYVGREQILNSFWDINTSGQLTSAGGTGKTTVLMKTKSTFIGSGWDFVWETANGQNDIWAICEGVSYPKLAWQFIPGDFDNNKDVDFIDFATLATKWMQTDSTLYCGGTDLTGDGLVNLEDLYAFAENWLQ